MNPLTKKEIKFSEDYRKVPIVRMGGELFKDSPVIIDELIARLRETKVMSDEEHAVFCSSDAKKWAEWADKQLAVLLFPNLTRNFSESYQVGRVCVPETTACQSVQVRASVCAREDLLEKSGQVNTAVWGGVVGVHWCAVLLVCRGLFVAPPSQATQLAGSGASRSSPDFFFFCCVSSGGGGLWGSRLFLVLCGRSRTSRVLCFSEASTSTRKLTTVVPFSPWFSDIER